MSRIRRGKTCVWCDARCAAVPCEAKGSCGDSLRATRVFRVLVYRSVLVHLQSSPIKVDLRWNPFPAARFQAFTCRRIHGSSLPLDFLIYRCFEVGTFVQEFSTISPRACLFYVVFFAKSKCARRIRANSSAAFDFCLFFCFSPPACIL